MPDVLFYRQDTTQDRLRIFTPWGYGEFQLHNYVNSFGTIAGLAGARAQEAAVSTQLCPYPTTPGGPSTWEPLVVIGLGGTSFSTLVGMAHGHERVVAKSVLVDGVDVTANTPEFTIAGTQIIVAQQTQLILPSDGTTVCCNVNRKWTANASGLFVNTVFSPLSGYEWYRMLSAMLPIQPMGTGGAQGLNQIQMGATATIQSTLPTPYGRHDIGTQEATYIASHSGHPYKIKATLPSGGPRVTPTPVNWSAAAPDCAWWSNGATNAKLYVADIRIDPPPITAFQRTYSTRYEITK